MIVKDFFFFGKKRKSLLTYLLLPQALRNLLPASFASLLCSGTWFRADLSCHVCFTPLHPDRLNSDGNNSRRACPIWESPCISAGLQSSALSPRLDLALKNHPLPHKGCANYAYSSWKHFLGSWFSPWETSMWIPPRSRLVLQCQPASASSLTSSAGGIYGVGTPQELEKSCNLFMVQGTVQMQNAGKQEASWCWAGCISNHSHFSCIYFYHREGFFCSWVRGRLSKVLLVFASLPSCECKSSLLISLYGGKTSSKSPFLN